MRKTFTYRSVVSVAFDEIFEGYRRAFYASPLASTMMSIVNLASIRWHYFSYYL